MMKRYQNYIAAALAVCLTTGATFSYANAQAAKADHLPAAAHMIQQASDTKVVKTESNLSAKKEEMVYIFANPDGSTDHTLVSACLKNPDSLDLLADISDLTEIHNIKGQETFTKEGSHLVWAANGADIYYQGQSKKDLPVSVNVSYILDGNELAPEEIAGKNGKVTIRFEYENHTKKTASIGGAEETLFVPYLAVTGIVVDLDQFANIEVTNGTVLTDGSRAVILCLSLPGLADNLSLEDRSLFPEYAEITADAANFSLIGTMTVFTSQPFQSLNGKNLDSLGSLGEAVLKLSDAAGQLEDGSAALYEGAAALFSGASSLENGLNTLSDSSNDLNQGAAALSAGTEALSAGAKSLLESTETLATGIQTSKAGSDQLAAGYAPVLEGAAALKNGLNQTAQGIQAVTIGMDTACDSLNQTIAANEQVLAGLKQLYAAAPSEEIKLLVQTLEITVQGQKQIAASMTEGKDGLNTLSAGTDTVIQGLLSLTSGIQSLSDGTNSLQHGLAQLETGSSEFKTGVSSLYGASVQVKDGAAALTEGTSALIKGVSKLSDGSSALASGVSELVHGAKELSEGTAEFNKTGIQKLVSIFDEDIDLLLERVSAMTELAAENSTFSGLADGMQGSVCYLIKTAQITAK